jgi:hypothetical protein
MKWYYSKNGTQRGPIEQEELISKIASGEVTQADLVWKDGMSDWLPVSKIYELSVIPLQSAVGSGPPANGTTTPYAPPTTVGQVPAHLSGPTIPTYLWQSIVITIFCCWPLGIPAIVYAAKVESLKNRGDIQAAMAASSRAKKWCIIAACAGLAVVLIWVILVMGLGIATNGHH